MQSIQLPIKIKRDHRIIIHSQNSKNSKSYRDLWDGRIIAPTIMPMAWLGKILGLKTNISSSTINGVLVF